MKRKLFIEPLILLTCLTSVILVSSCEPASMNPCEEQTNERILRFKEYCYDTAGNVTLEHPDGYAATEWMIPVETNTDVLTLFHRLTALEVHPAEKYDYSYHSEDYRYVCRLTGKAQSTHGKYATLHLRIEGCPEITAIHFLQVLP